MENARDTEIRKAQEETKVRETLILQKINASHRIAFIEKFPGQCEHMLRLLTERIHLGLDKRDNVIINDPATWKISPTDIKELAQALEIVYRIHKDLKAK